jgi:hypothetical protein
LFVSEYNVKAGQNIENMVRSGVRELTEGLKKSTI